MKHEKIGGSTCNISEIIVEYTKNGPKSEIVNIPEETKWNKVTTAFWEWFFHLIGWWIGIMGAMLVLSSLPGTEWFNQLFTWKILITSFSMYLVVISGISLCHLSSKFDNKWKKWFAIRTGNKPRNKARFSNFESKTFVIYDIENTVVEYTATKDVARQLKKVWIKEESRNSILESQANIKGLRLISKDEKYQWNVYFFFKRVPKDGELSVEWI